MSERNAVVYYIVYFKYDGTLSLVLQLQELTGMQAEIAAQR